MNKSPKKKKIATEKTNPILFLPPAKPITKPIPAARTPARTQEGGRSI